MKLTIAADLHLKPNNPISRSDDYATATLRKLQQLVDYCNENRSTLLLAGDVFDRSDVPIWYLNRVIELFKTLGQPCHLVAGNHDLKFHNVEYMQDSSLWTLIASTEINLVHGLCLLGDDLHLWGECFGVEPVYELYKHAYNILILHTPIFETEVPWYMANEAMTAHELTEKYPGFDLYVCGDIHQRCITDKVINPGSMMRSSKAQKDFQPAFVTVDTETGDKEVHYFDVEQDVWRVDFDQVVEDSFSSDLSELSEVLLARNEKLSYKEVVLDLSSSEAIKQRFMGIIDGYDTERS